ncbi:M23 family metallopeptidase [Advenella sp. FME57]|uniref:M23 family metallopeptidase n=1 Tax=Advenella sp. FME57 TaxID=2742604 RepID=UPI001865DD51|nr:M23 family metallopeptidase [Advenella sp. FME57]
MLKIKNPLIFVLSILITSSAVASDAVPILVDKNAFFTLDQLVATDTADIENISTLFLDTPLESNVRINSDFGYRLHPVSGKWAGHQGLDYAAPKGTPIRATARGKISFIGLQKGYGKVIFIEHNDKYSTVYAHQSRFNKGLKIGSLIEQGQTIGYVGSTGTSSGPHLHYELRNNNQPVNPVHEKTRLAASTTDVR